ncbi:MAG: cytochrome c [bacterium]|nr:cytochrome c [bacterium]
MKQHFLSAAIVFALLSSALPAAAALRPNAEKGKLLFGGNGCGVCHTVSGPEKKLPVTERHNAKGPTLWYAGSKFGPGYLAQWLKNPKPFRGVKYGTLIKRPDPHPALANLDARDVATYLQTLKDPEMRTGTVPRWKKIPRGVLRRARILFQKKQPCYACHKVRIRKTVYRQPIEVGGFSGPHFFDTGRRLNPDFIIAFLQRPERYNPNGRMPVYGDKAFTRLSEKDMIALAAYIASLK